MMMRSTTAARPRRSRRDGPEIGHVDPADDTRTGKRESEVCPGGLAGRRWPAECDSPQGLWRSSASAAGALATGCAIFATPAPAWGDSGKITPKKSLSSSANPCNCCERPLHPAHQSSLVE